VDVRAIHRYRFHMAHASGRHLSSHHPVHFRYDFQIDEGRCTALEVFASRAASCFQYSQWFVYAQAGREECRQHTSSIAEQWRRLATKGCGWKQQTSSLRLNLGGRVRAHRTSITIPFFPCLILLLLKMCCFCLHLHAQLAVEHLLLSKVTVQ
jgi:hypothetical protein